MMFNIIKYYHIKEKASEKAISFEQSGLLECMTLTEKNCVHVSIHNPEAAKIMILSEEYNEERTYIF